jgi:hypothetical protein
VLATVTRYTVVAGFRMNDREPHAEAKALTAFEGLICRLGAKIKADRRTKGEGRHTEAPEGLEQAPQGVRGGGDGACAGGRLPLHRERLSF